MNTDANPHRITHLGFKYEGESEEGMAIGKLSDQNGAPVFADGRWVTKQEALRIARDLRVEMDDF